MDSLAICHPDFESCITFTEECPTMSEVIDRILETGNIEKRGIDDEIRVLQGKCSAIERATDRIHSSIAIAAARQRYPKLGKIWPYSKWTDFDIYLVDTNTENGVFNAPLFIRMNDLHEVVEILLLERISYYLWTNLDDYEQLHELYAARAIEALRGVGDSENAKNVVRGNFKLLLRENDPKKFWGSLSVNGVTLIGFDEAAKMAHVVEPRLPAEETSDAFAN